MNHEELRERALDSQTEHDKNWVGRGNEEDMARIRKLLTKSYWNLTFKANDFKVELFRVIPSFKSNED